MARHRADTGKPGLDARVTRKIEPTLVRLVGVGIERDVGDGKCRSGEPVGR
jgi:hypothetical protein